MLLCGGFEDHEYLFRRLDRSVDSFGGVQIVVEYFQQLPPTSPAGVGREKALRKAVCDVSFENGGAEPRAFENVNSPQNPRRARKRRQLLDRSRRREGKGSEIGLQ